jgi:hypothetical protein
MRLTSPLSLLTLAFAGCHATAAITPDSEACPQTYEFGNYGCARVVAVVDYPSPPWPAAYRYDLRAVSVATPELRSSYYSSGHTTPASVTLTITRYESPPVGLGDTLSVWVVGKLLDESNAQVNVPLPVFAADSVLHVVRFAPVGSRPVVDTVHLTLHRP